MFRRILNMLHGDVVVICIRVDIDLLNDLILRTGARDKHDVMERAFAMLDRATLEVSKKRVLFSAKDTGENVRRFYPLELERVRGTA